MIQNKTEKKKENTKENTAKKQHKKLVCALFIAACALFEPVLLCGCASARDEVVMALGSGGSAVQDPPGDEAAGADMTEVSFSAG